MKFDIYSYNNALEIIEMDSDLLISWHELKDLIENISENDVIANFRTKLLDGVKTKSISKSLTQSISSILIENKWEKDAAIYLNGNYKGENWKLDYFKNEIGIVIGINHTSGIAWNLIRPSLAAEKSNILKALNTRFSVIITIQESLRKDGGFDNAIATYEKTIDYLLPFYKIITKPLIVVGLGNLENHAISYYVDFEGKKIGKIIEFGEGN